MDYEWDEAKSQSNLRRRGFGFEIVSALDWDLALGTESQIVDGEVRDVWMAPIENELYVLVTTDRGNALRVISLRVASNKEKMVWLNEFCQK